MTSIATFPTLKRKAMEAAPCEDIAKKIKYLRAELEAMATKYPVAETPVEEPKPEGTLEPCPMELISVVERKAQPSLRTNKCRQFVDSNMASFVKGYEEALQLEEFCTFYPADAGHYAQPNNNVVSWMLFHVRNGEAIDTHLSQEPSRVLAGHVMASLQAGLIQARRASIYTKFPAPTGTDCTAVLQCLSDAEIRSISIFVHRKLGMADQAEATK